MIQALKILWSIFKPNRKWVRRFMLCDWDGPAWRIDCKTCGSQSFYPQFKKRNIAYQCGRGENCGHYQYQRDVGLVK